MSADYWNIFSDLMQQRAALIAQRNEVEVELTKINPAIISVFGLLPIDDQKANQQLIDDLRAESAGLQDAIKLVFSTHAGVFLTVSDVRDYLSDMGFDFRQYKANPLASVGTTLKRIADSGYVNTKDIGSGTLYLREHPLNKLKIASLGDSAPTGTLGTKPVIDVVECPSRRAVQEPNRNIEGSLQRLRRKRR